MDKENAYFTEEDIKRFKSGSLPFPFVIYEGDDPKNVIEVYEIVAISGMTDNKGTPNQLIVYKHMKNKETEILTYKLVPTIENG